MSKTYSYKKWPHRVSSSSIDLLICVFYWLWGYEVRPTYCTTAAHAGVCVIHRRVDFCIVWPVFFVNVNYIMYIFIYLFDTNCNDLFMFIYM